MPAVLSLLFSRAGIVGMTLAGLVMVFGAQEIRLNLAQHGEASARAAAARSAQVAKTSEARRSTEYAQAKQALTDAEAACAQRVARAVKSGSAIRKILETPNATDPKSHCPLRSVVGADELRNALQPDP